MWLPPFTTYLIVRQHSGTLHRRRPSWVLLRARSASNSATIDSAVNSSYIASLNSTAQVIAYLGIPPCALVDLHDRRPAAANCSANAVALSFGFHNKPQWVMVSVRRRLPADTYPLRPTSAGTRLRVAEPRRDEVRLLTCPHQW